MWDDTRFEPDGAGFIWGLVFGYQPRGRIAGVFDRFLLARRVRRAFQWTFAALDWELGPSAHEPASPPPAR